MQQIGVFFPVAVWVAAYPVNGFGGKGGFLLRGSFRLLRGASLMLRLCLFFLLCLLKLCKMPVNGVYHFGGGIADCFKGTPKLCKLLSAAPPGDISKRIVRRIKPVVLADGIGDAFRFHFTGTAVNAGLLFLFRGV